MIFCSSTHAWDKWNRFREKHIDPAGDTLLGPSGREKEITEEKKRQHEAELQKREQEHQKELEQQKLLQQAELEGKKLAQQQELKRLELEHQTKLEAIRNNNLADIEKEKAILFEKEKEIEREENRKNAIIAALIGVGGVLVGAIIPLAVRKRRKTLHNQALNADSGNSPAAG